MRSLLLNSIAALSLVCSPLMAAPQSYVLDESHSQILFSYNHLGYSTTWGMFSGFGGSIQFDQESPENSSVSVEFPVRSMFTGWEARFDHFMADDFFAADEDEVVSFVSTGIEVTGENTGVITGDLTLNGITKEVKLDATLNQASEHPMQKKAWIGFDASTTILRSDFGVGNFAPFVGDEVDIQISIEAAAAE